MRFFKNIFRLPAVFLPIVLTSVAAVILLLLSSAVESSCGEIIDTMGESYDVTVNIKTKVMQEKVLAEDRGKYEVINTNDRKIDSSLMSLLENTVGTQDINFVSNQYSLPTGYIITGDEYDMITEAGKAGEGFTLEDHSFRINEVVLYNLFPVAVSNEALLGQVFNSDSAEIYYREGMGFGDGILLPEPLYRKLNAPETLVIGWYTQNRSGVGLKVKDEDGKIILDYFDVAHILELLRQTPPTPLFLKVAGYHKGAEGNPQAVICDLETWEAIFKTTSPYRMDLKGTAIDNFGMEFVDVTLSDAGITSSYMEELMEKGVDGEKFLMVADDYSYKFAVSQIEGIHRFASVLLYASGIFGLLTVILALFYGIRKRKKEVYTYRTLGRSRGRIILSVGAEISFVLLISVALGVACGCFAGDVLCSAINETLRTSAATSAENITKIASIMKNSLELKTQLEGAVEDYLKMGVSLSFNLQKTTVELLFAAWLCLSAAVFAVVGVFTGKSLMKRED